MIRRAPTKTAPSRQSKCAIYTRKSTEEGLQQQFNSLDAQRESGEAYVVSQQHEGWVCLPDHYDDGGYSGGNMDRPALRRLIADIESGKVDTVVVYKVDRLSRSLMDFSRLIEVLDRHKVAFVSVTQQFNTATSMGRLMLNVLLSFAQFERELVSERTRDKIAATRRKGHYSGGTPVLGYDVVDTKLVVNEPEADLVRQIFRLYLDHEAMIPVVRELTRRGWRNKLWTTKKGRVMGGREFCKNAVHQLITNPVYAGKVRYKDEVHLGLHEAIVDPKVFAKVQETLSRNRVQGGADVRNRYGALLRGLLHCGHCNCAMVHTYTVKREKRYRYYTCSNAQKKGHDACPTGSLPAGEIEQFVVDEIKAIGQDPQLVADTIRQAHEQVEAEEKRLLAEQRALHRDVKRANDDLLSLAGMSPSDQRSGRLADVQERLRTAENRLGEIASELESLLHERIDESAATVALAQFDPVWSCLSPREQEQLLRLLIERIVYDGESGQMSIEFATTGIAWLIDRHAEKESA